MQVCHSRLISVICTVLVWFLAAPPLPAQQQEELPFRIRILEGEGAINNVRQVLNRAASVVVEDENHNPLSGVSVTFFLPNEGPSGLFPNGSRVLAVFTDNNGVASSRPIHFNNQIGLMRINVVASLFSQTASATITQTNVSSSGSVRSSFVPATGTPRLVDRHASHKKLIIVVGVVAVGIGAGVFLATRTSAKTATISVGAASAGTPQ
jgi:hypothetical protein